MAYCTLQGGPSEYHSTFCTREPWCWSNRNLVSGSKWRLENALWILTHPLSLTLTVLCIWHDKPLHRYQRQGNIQVN